MGMRVHTAVAADVALSILPGDQLVEVYGDEFVGIEGALVIEDTGNCEAWVLVGDLDDLADLATGILKQVNTRNDTNVG